VQKYEFSKLYMFAIFQLVLCDVTKLLKTVLLAKVLSKSRNYVDRMGPLTKIPTAIIQSQAIALSHYNYSVYI